MKKKKKQTFVDALNIKLISDKPFIVIMRLLRKGMNKIFFPLPKINL